MSSPIAASGVWADMSTPIPSFGFDDIKDVQSPSAPAKKGKKSAAKTPTPPKVQEAIMTAKVNSCVGNDIRWDVIMQEIAEVAPAPPRRITPVVKTILPLKLHKTIEDSTSAGETTDSEFSSDCGSPVASAIRPPPGLSGYPGLAPPGLSAPPGLAGPPGLAPPPGLGSPPGIEDDCPPPPGFEVAASTAKTTAKAAKLPPWRRS